jgi:hypothetical protein
VYATVGVSDAAVAGGPWSAVAGASSFSWANALTDSRTSTEPVATAVGTTLDECMVAFLVTGRDGRPAHPIASGQSMVNRISRHGLIPIVR